MNETPIKTVSHCTFTSKLSKKQVAALTVLAEAAIENAKAIQAIAQSLKGPDGPLLSL